MVLLNSTGSDMIVVFWEIIHQEINNRLEGNIFFLLLIVLLALETLEC